jgi:hypothetical protein
MLAKKGYAIPILQEEYLVGFSLHLNVHIAARYG